MTPLEQKNTRLISSRWLLAVILILPAAVPYFSHFILNEGLIPTGFIQGDQPYCLANARGHFDSGTFSLFYENPCDPDPASRRIYFQPHLLILGVVIFLTGTSPGIVYVIFGFFAALVCARIAIGLYEFFAGTPHGVELLAILTLSVFVELLLGKNLPLWLIAGIVLLFSAHVWYYLVYLPGFPTHEVLMTQWQQPWNFLGKVCSQHTDW